MEVTFTRQSGVAYSVSIQRSDGVALDLKPAGGSQAMPHDLAHFIIEGELGLQHGFWGCAAAGAVLPGMAVASGRRRPHATERSRAVLKAAGQCLNEAEHIVRVVLEVALGHLDERSPSSALARINDAWRPPGPSRPRLDPAQVTQLCSLVRSTQARWRSLEPGAHLALRWPLPEAKARNARG
jgi:hypothetical protein